MENVILLTAMLIMAGAVAFVLTVHFRQCKANRAVVNRLESTHSSTSVNYGRHHGFASVQ
jgi:hypothetical protein